MIEKKILQDQRTKVEIDLFLKDRLRKYGYIKSYIEKTPLVTRIKIYALYPRRIVGPKGSSLRQLIEEIKQKFNLENVEINVERLSPWESFDAQAAAVELARKIEKGYSWKAIAHRLINNLIARGAQGVEIKLHGVLHTKGARKRRERIFKGYIKKVGDQTRMVSKGYETIFTKAGTSGIRVAIVPPDAVFPDKVIPSEWVKEHNTKVSQDEEKRVDEQVKGEQ